MLSYESSAALEPEPLCPSKSHVSESCPQSDPIKRGGLWGGNLSLEGYDLRMELVPLQKGPEGNVLASVSICEHSKEASCVWKLAHH